MARHFRKKYFWQFWRAVQPQDLIFFENLIGYCWKTILLAFRISKQNLNIFLSSRATAISKYVIKICHILFRYCWLCQTFWYNQITRIFIFALIFHPVSCYKGEWHSLFLLQVVIWVAYTLVLRIISLQ